MDNPGYTLVCRGSHDRLHHSRREAAAGGQQAGRDDVVQRDARRARVRGARRGARLRCLTCSPSRSALTTPPAVQMTRLAPSSTSSSAAGGGRRVGHGVDGAGRARCAAAGPQGHPRPPGAGDDDGEETGVRPPVESRSISPGAARSKAAEDFEGRKKEKNLSSDYHVRRIEWLYDC
jgi:hypothetical protein